jgi:hypothetical protein
VLLPGALDTGEQPQLDNSSNVEYLAVSQQKLTDVFAAVL